MRLALEGTPAELPQMPNEAPAGEALVRLFLCDTCPHMVVSAGDIDGRPCRACAPWGRLAFAGLCAVDPTPPG